MDFYFKTLVVTITQHSPMTKQLRGLHGRKISIEGEVNCLRPACFDDTI